MTSLCPQCEGTGILDEDPVPPKVYLVLDSWNYPIDAFASEQDAFNHKWKLPNPGRFKVLGVNVRRTKDVENLDKGKKRKVR